MLEVQEINEIVGVIAEGATGRLPSVSFQSD
jgi:hypothetical protein